MLGGKICEGIIILDKENEIVAIISAELVTVKRDYKYAPILNKKHSMLQTIFGFFIFVAIMAITFYFIH